MRPRERASTPSGGRSSVLTVEGDLINRCEIFDEADLDAALARFEELSRPAPRLENAASRVDKRFRRASPPATGTRMAEMLSDGFAIEDRRRVVNTGTCRVEMPNCGVHAYGVADRRECDINGHCDPRQSASPYVITDFRDRDQRPDAFRIEMLAVVEIDADERMAAVVVFDARRLRRRHRGARRPIPRRRSGRPFRDLVGNCRGIRRAQSR